MAIKHNIFSGFGKGSTESIMEEIDGKSDVIFDISKRNEHISKSLDGVTVTLIAHDDFDALRNKKRYQNMFDYVYLSQHAAHWIGESQFKSILRNNNEKNHDPNSILGPEYNNPSRVSSIEVETGKYIFQLNETKQKELLNKIISIAEENGLEPIQPAYNAEDKLQHSSLIFT